MREISDQMTDRRDAFFDLGETVTYIGAQAGKVAGIVVILRRNADRFPTAHQAQPSDADVTANVLQADIAEPRKDDTITDADGNWYSVHDYLDVDGLEWFMELKATSNG